MVVGAENYYLGIVADGQEEYYTGAGEAPGRWMGGGIAHLRLSGEVESAILRELLAGNNPLNGDQLGIRNGASGRVAGFDLTFSAPKSVSLLYGLGSPDQATAVKDAHDQAVTDGLTYLERHATSARRDAGGTRRMSANGLLGAAFDHRTSRAGDPQLHTHVLVANLVLGFDGRWSAPDARLLYFHARTAGFVYQASLRAGLVESLGVRFGPVSRGSAEIADLDPGLLRAFSTRRAEIEKYLAVHGESSRKAAELAALATRSAKSLAGEPDGNAIHLRDYWRQQATELGFDPADLFNNLGPARAVELSDTLSDQLERNLIAPWGLTEKESTFERRDVVRVIAENLPEGGYLDQIDGLADRVLARADVVPLPSRGRGGERLQTTTELLGVEAELLRRSIARQGDQAGKVERDLTESVLARRPELSAEQQSMVRALTTSGVGVQVVVGKAGAGKTTALFLAREAFEQAGYRVTGTALAARAAEELEASAGIASVTLARFFSETDWGHSDLGPSDVVVVDEAGMVGTRALERLVKLTDDVGAKLILVGDPRQLSEIDAGGAFAALARDLGATELMDNRRQVKVWERHALDQLRSGDVATALSAYDTHDRICMSETMVEAQRALVDAWVRGRCEGQSSLMMAVNRSDVANLNELARAELFKRGELGEEILRAHDRSFAIGDEVVCLRNSRGLGVINGTRGTVVGSEDRCLLVETAKGPRVLTDEYLANGHVGHSYATTVHKAQGATYDRAFVLATESLTREAGYVSMSRARAGTELFVVAGGFESGLGPDIGDEEPLARVAARLKVSRSKELARDQFGDDQGSGGDQYARKRTDRMIAQRLEQRMSRLDLAIESPDRRLAKDHEIGSERRPMVRRVEPAIHVTSALGSRPMFSDQRTHYDRVVDLIENYRVSNNVTGESTLGPRPSDVEALQDYEAVTRQIHQFDRGRGIELEPPSVDLAAG
jgi:Ti-type conjugative transfer relaxase TraA